jgi:uncharacterized protein HemX
MLANDALSDVAAADAAVRWLVLLAVVLAMVAIGLGAALYATRQELKRSHRLCMHAWVSLGAEQRTVKRGQQERDQLVLQIDRMLTRITELQEAARILGGLAGEQLDRMSAEASGLSQVRRDWSGASVAQDT